MYRVVCKQCGASGITEDGGNLQAAVNCTCCPEAHDHDEAANGCPHIDLPLGERHDGADCTHPSEDGVMCRVLTPAGEPCPGGHCGPGIEDCTACRPVEAFWIGVAPMTPAG